MSSLSLSWRSLSKSKKSDPTPLNARHNRILSKMICFGVGELARVIQMCLKKYASDKILNTNDPQNSIALFASITFILDQNLLPQFTNDA